MSISSMTEDASLRLRGPGAGTTDIATVTAAAAATAAAKATETGVTVEQATEAGKQAGASAQGGGPAAAQPGPLSQLVKYIPTETITLYVAVLGALGDVKVPANGGVADADFSSRWAWMWILFGVTVVLTLGLGYRSQKNAGATNFKVPVFEVLAAGAAFLVWALSLPSTPLRDIGGYNYDAWNSVIILAGTVVIATTAYVVGKTVTWQKVRES